MYDPPSILKRAGLESSSRRLISSIGNTKKVAFFWQIFSSFSVFFKVIFEIFPDFFCRIGLDWRALVELHIPDTEKQRVFFLSLKKIFFQIFRFLVKKFFLTYFFKSFWIFFIDYQIFSGFFLDFFHILFFKFMLS